jgi:hypothetical protein
MGYSFDTNKLLRINCGAAENSDLIVIEGRGTDDLDVRTRDHG